MRTTVTIDDELLAKVKLVAAITHRTIGSVLEDAVRQLLAEQGSMEERGRFSLPRFTPAEPGLRSGVDLFDAEQVAELLGDNERDDLS